MPAFGDGSVMPRWRVINSTAIFSAVIDIILFSITVTARDNTVGRVVILFLVVSFIVLL